LEELQAATPLVPLLNAQEHGIEVHGPRRLRRCNGMKVSVRRFPLGTGVSGLGLADGGPNFDPLARTQGTLLIPG
jgi:hypothetical protein